jgi:anti-sigma regulatory factor (Ser/Thr protein kinase)/ActR/RegA family two-component response regulator
MSRVLIIDSQTPVSREIGELLTTADLPFEYAAGHIDALHQLRARAFSVIVTSADSAIEEALALLQEMRVIRPNLKCIVLAPHSTPNEIIAALRARVFGCFTPPFDADEIACVARNAATGDQSNEDIEVLSARPGWIAVRVNCRLATADRLMTFARQFAAQLPENARQEIMLALREILVNAMEHGAKFNPDQVVEVNAIRTARTMTFRVRDPGAGFRKEDITYAVHSNSSDDPTAHIVRRNQQGMRAGGYGLLLAAGTVDELIYNELGNEVILIKYLDSPAQSP